MCGVLAGDEPEAELGSGFGRQDGLRTRPLVAGGDAGNVAGRREQQLLGDVLRLWVAHWPFGADPRPGPLYLWVDPGHHAAIGLGRLDDAVVETVDVDVHVQVAQARERRNHIHRRRRIDGRGARVLVEGEESDPKLYVQKSAAAELDRRTAGCIE